MARTTSTAIALLLLSFVATPALADGPRTDWYRSNEFRQSGARCGTVVPNVSFISPNDCDFDRTVINAEYEDGRTLVVQVVFHVIETTGGAGRLSDEHIRSQIEILNEDFQGILGTPGEGGANAQIEFVLARFDPDGNPTNGIDRVVNNAYFNDPGPGAGSNPMKTALHWDTTRYLNIYTNDADGFLGYATFPFASGSSEDGVVVLWDSVGRNAPGGPPYNQGRTATHEIGHYLGLFHTFDGGCGSGYTAGDLIADTQAEAQPHYGCSPNTPSGCGGGLSPVRNYMDYSDDACFDHYTVEQANRMRCAIINYRNVNAKPTAAFEYDAGGLSIEFQDQSTDDESPDALAYYWDFGDGTGSNERNPTHEYAEPGLYTVRLEVVDPGSGTAIATQDIEVDESAGCCQTGTSGGRGAIALALPVMFVLLRRRRPRD